MCLALSRHQQNNFPTASITIGHQSQTTTEPLLTMSRMWALASMLDKDCNCNAWVLMLQHVQLKVNLWLWDLCPHLNSASTKLSRHWQIWHSSSRPHWDAVPKCWQNAQLLCDCCWLHELCCLQCRHNVIFVHFGKVDTRSFTQQSVS